ncbi:DNA-binding transcriptional regulator YhcF (GntR family) [Saonia flava]|uniref:DNA-binding transcriptional regulator YhcF (GntR family) n=1 Tax=Saonia flava TaxID=523696 RepID=A0A846QSM1_9FLAO|nr:GntR family transcriptional regulator [Saonia flava]NJB70207.1 DNA-binding transcriptional regulator YhcF (GntR family) [Saonia flava]
MLKLIVIKEESKVPKYKQIIDSILSAIENGKIKLDDRLPSVNDLLIEFDISRDTVVKAYNHLKKNKIIDSIPGKGFYVIKDQLAIKAKVFLLFNKLSPHKKIIYDSFATTLGDNATVDFFIYENNYRHFKDLIMESKKRVYTHYVIICHFEEGGDDVLNFVKKEIPLEKLIVLDKKLDGLAGKVSSVYQDFENDIYSALVQLNSKLKKYNHIKLLLRKKTYHPVEIKNGFFKFCGQFAYDFGIIEEIENSKIDKGTVYINLKESDLVVLIKKIKESKLSLGKDIGIISYNETPLKEVLLDGITVISTDFENLGRKAAEIILNNQFLHIDNPFHVIPRNSL